MLHIFYALVKTLLVVYNLGDGKQPLKSMLKCRPYKFYILHYKMYFILVKFTIC